MIIPIPTEHWLSPANGTPGKFNTETKVITDESGMEWSLDYCLGTRNNKAMRKYLEGFCKGDSV